MLLVTILLIGGAPLHAQSGTTITRKVVSGGGGRTSGTDRELRGTLSQTAAGRLTYGAASRHDVGFWYWAYQPEMIARVSIPSLEAEVGTRMMVPLRLSIDDDARSALLPRPFHARIRFNHTLLHPAGNTPPCDYDGNDCIVEIDGIAQQEGIIAETEFIVALGDSESTPLVIEEFTWTQKGEERIATVREHGELRLLGVCRVGGEIRLILSGAFASRVQVYPNPATTSTTVEFVSAESGPATLRLVDLLGREVHRFTGIEAEAERLYRIDADLGGIASGSYMVVFTTPSRTITHPLLITQ